MLKEFRFPLRKQWASLVAQLVKESACNAGDPGSIHSLRRSPGEGLGYPLQYSWGFRGFPGGSDGKESICNAGHLGLIPGSGRSSEGGHGNPLQDSCLENPSGQKSLVGYSPWDHKESDTTEWLGTARQGDNMPSWRSVFPGLLCNMKTIWYSFCH